MTDEHRTMGFSTSDLDWDLDPEEPYTLRLDMRGTKQAVYINGHRYRTGRLWKVLRKLGFNRMPKARGEHNTVTPTAAAAGGGRSVFVNDTFIVTDGTLPQAHTGETGARNQNEEKS